MTSVTTGFDYSFFYLRRFLFTYFIGKGQVKDRKGQTLTDILFQLPYLFSLKVIKNVLQDNHFMGSFRYLDSDLRKLYEA